MTERLSWDAYAMELAKTAAQRSEDPYVKVGACALRYDKSVASLGYNGVPPGITIDWADRDLRRKYVVHAETNCLRYCKPGECEVVAVTMLPCASCLTQIACHGIKRVIFSDVYDKDSSALEMAGKFNIQLVQLYRPQNS